MSTDRSTASPCAGCSHAREAHEHYRRGSDCALCDCDRFRDRRRTNGYARESGKVLRSLSGVARWLGRTGR